jgi:hypothetical protein
MLFDNFVNKMLKENAPNAIAPQQNPQIDNLLKQASIFRQEANALGDGSSMEAGTPEIKSEFDAVSKGLTGNKDVYTGEQIGRKAQRLSPQVVAQIRNKIQQAEKLENQAKGLGWNGKDNTIGAQLPSSNLPTPALNMDF